MHSGISDESYESTEHLGSYKVIGQSMAGKVAGCGEIVFIADFEKKEKIVFLSLTIPYGYGHKVI